VRSGDALPTVADGKMPRLVLEVVGQGMGKRDWALPGTARPYPLWVRIKRHGVVAFHAETGSLPDDPAAVLTTIGTGGLPFQHGITGTLIRNDRGGVVRAWGPGAPVPVIASLGDDLDRSWQERPRIGMVAQEGADRGIVGGNWYPHHDQDDIEIVKGRGSASDALHKEERAAVALLHNGYGADRIPDLLAVVLNARGRRFADSASRLYADARRTTGNRVALVATGTGAARRSESAGRNLAAKGTGSGKATAGLVRRLDRHLGAHVVAALQPGGLFLDRKAAGHSSVSSDAAARALRRHRGPDGSLMFADAFAGTAVSFARYC
jgi:hypothetical protein